MRILVVDHPYHRITRSFDFITGPLAARHEIETVYHNTYESDLPPLKLDAYDAHLFLQVPPKHPHPNSTWVPMYDSVALSRRGVFHPLGLPDLKHLCFCRRLYDEVSRCGVAARYLQYWPAPRPVVGYGEPALFFWYRTPSLTWEDVTRIIGDFTLARVFIKNDPDPGFEKIVIPDADRRRYRIRECDSFMPREEYEKVLAEHNIAIASRPLEGIGRTTLELMSRGYCVVALDRPTANEYLVHNVNGILMRDVGPVDLRSYQAIGRAAWETVREKSREWPRQLDSLLEFIVGREGGSR